MFMPFELYNKGAQEINRVEKGGVGTL